MASALNSVQILEAEEHVSAIRSVTLPISVIVPVREEARNLPRCLESLRGMGEVFVVDSFSTDGTVEIAQTYGAKVVEFDYHGGWPKKRQWALDTLTFSYEWILLLDADEVLTPELKAEMHTAICDSRFDGYFIALRMRFLGRTLRHGDVSFYKLSLFRRGKGHFECRLRDQDTAMGDMEVHEHVTVDGPTSRLKNFVCHHNVESLSHYVRKHDQYSNWECRVLLTEDNAAGSIPASLTGTQAQRRRWLKRHLLRLPGSPILLFLYRYCLRLGFLDGVPGLIYCAFQAIQLFHTRAKMYEVQVATPRVDTQAKDIEMS